jgi:NADPH:quinone reductase-like Zn-dependent oxidoreductase
MQRHQIVITQFGSADLLTHQTDELDENLDPTEVLIDVHFSGINFADIVMRLGMYRDAPPKPFTPGYEMSGVVKKIGHEVRSLKVGDQVMAGIRFGGYASVVKVPEWQAIKIPSGLSLSDGAAIPVNFFTAELALHEFFRVKKGDKILIDCATGGVGVYCLQMGVAAGAEVVGLTSQASKKSFIESYGARAMTHEEFWKSYEGDFSFILNSTGGKTLKDLYPRLDKAGLLLCIGLQQAIEQGKSSFLSQLKAVAQSPWYPILKLMMQSKSVAGFNALKFFDDERWLKRLLSALKLNTFKPHVDKIFPANQVAEAHRYLESKKAKGKVLISWKT